MTTVQRSALHAQIKQSLDALEAASEQNKPVGRVPAFERQTSTKAVFEHRLPHAFVLDSNTGPLSLRPIIPGEAPSDVVYTSLEELCELFPNMKPILNTAYSCGIFYREELAGSVFHTRVWIFLVYGSYL
jgi:hypothetical protein